MDKESQNHDRYVRRLSDATLASALADTRSRNAWNQRDHEQRWIMKRKAALMREQKRRRLAAPLSLTATP